MKRVLFLFLIVFFGIFQNAQAASFKIEAFDMDIVVEADGSAQITETLSYAFDGAYNGILATIRHHLPASEIRLFADGGIELSKVSKIGDVPYTFTATQHGEETNIQAYTPGKDDTRVFQIQYRLPEFALRYRDSGRVNQKLLLATCDYGHASFRITYPGGILDTVELYTHGAAFGAPLRKEGSAFIFNVGHVSSGDFVEIQSLFPEEWLNKAETIDEPIREKAIALEQKIREDFEKASAEREARRRILSMASMTALTLYVFASAVALMRLCKRYGLMQSLRSVVDTKLSGRYPAAFAEAVYRMRVSADSLSATLMDLVDKGVLTMTEAEDDICFTRAKPSREKPSSALLGHQAYLVRWLFKDRDALWLHTLNAEDDYQKASEFTSAYAQFQRIVMQDVREAGLLHQNSGVITRWTVASITLALLLCIAFALLGQFLFAALSVVAGIVLVASFLRVERMTMSGRQYAEALEGFMDNYIDDLQSKPSAVIWRVPIAIALGLTEPLVHWIDANPEVIEAYDDYPFWMSIHFHHVLLRMDQSVHNLHRHNASVPNPDASDSSSGGGSSGGGGGSSHGAW